MISKRGRGLGYWCESTKNLFQDTIELDDSPDRVKYTSCHPSGVEWQKRIDKNFEVDKSETNTDP